MNCEQFTDLIPQRFDQELTPGQLSDWHQHAQECSQCQSEWNEYRQFMELIEDEKQSLHISDDFTARVMEQISHEKTIHWNNIFGLKPWLKVAAIVIPLIAGGWFGFTLAQNITSTEPATADTVESMNRQLFDPAYSSENAEMLAYSSPESSSEISGN